MPPLVRYAGGKNGAGVYQRLINEMPPHECYVEAFLGSGALMRRKRPAPGLNIGIDLDPAVIDRHLAAGVTGYSFHCADAIEWLSRAYADQRTLIYADPPYLGEARCDGRRDCYRYEMKEAERHEELLRILTTSAGMVMISGYASELYDSRLKGWRRMAYMAQTRGGLKEEIVWMNYDEPQELHDYRFLGDDFHDRCRIARKIKRWTAKLRGLPRLERAALIEAITQSSTTGD